MKKKNILWTLVSLTIVLFSGCIAGSEINPNNSIPSIEIGTDLYSNKTLMFEMKIPQGWKSDVMWQLPYGGVINFVNDRYPWWPSGDSGAIKWDLKTYGTLSLVQVHMDTQLVPIGYTLEYARSEELEREEGITYEGYTQLGGEKAWEIIRKYRAEGDLYQRDIHVIHGKRHFVLRFKVISTDAAKRDNVTAELKPQFDEMFASFKFID
jgi:hypothetical protein